MIFYFTATGNSKYIAEEIASKTGDELINIADCIQNNNYSYELKSEEKVGIVVPVYFFGIPMIVTEFLQKLKINNQNYYSYVVLNCGGTTGNAESFITKEFSVNAVFSVATVDNYVPMYKVETDKEKIKERLDKAKYSIEEITKHIENNDEGSFDALKGKFSKIITSILYPLYKNGRKTKKFAVNEKCIGCGLCEKICPRKVIQLEGKLPVWKAPQCEECFGCLHRCPVEAINYGKKSAKNGRYVNTRIDL